ncbi:MAG: hypothetical protein GKR95_02135 [Gammaproteobacteria bacterium]|nr:hypothetical protein [Gammaproteobacteria bacterium]
MARIEKGKWGNVRIHSTPESANNLEFSWLALVESVAACSLSLWIAWYWETYTHILVTAVCLSPFLLLRTKKSTVEGLEWFDFFFRKWATKWCKYDKLFDTSRHSFNRIGQYLVRKTETGGKPVLLVALLISRALRPLMLMSIAIITLVFALGIGLGSSVIKFASTSLNIIRHPKQSISEISANWFRMAFCSDIRNPPELLPGLDARGQHKRLSVANFVFDIKNRVVEVKILAIIFLLLLYPASIFYRWSLKSTFIFYLPLLWISYLVREAQQKEGEYITETQLLKRNLKSEVLGFTAKAPLILSIFVLLISAGSALISFNCHSWMEYLSSLEEGAKAFINYFLFLPGIGFLDTQTSKTITINSWHITRILAAIITIALYTYCEKLLINWEDSTNHDDKRAPIILFWSRFFRTAFSLFTLACGFYLIVWPVLKEWEWVGVVINLVPWG